MQTAARDYARFFGFEGTLLDDGIVRFALPRGAVELAPGNAPPALRFTPEHSGESNFVIHGLSVLCEARSDGLNQADTSIPPHDDAVIAIDHIVVHTTAPQRAISTWRDHHGMRLALDREFPKRHLRLQFFRSNRITLEYASPLPSTDELGDDRFFGISYRVANLERLRIRLIAAGFAVSEIRQGMRPGTRVATVKSHTCNVPTLILEVLPDAPA